MSKAPTLDDVLKSRGLPTLATATRASGVLSTGLRSLDRIIGGGLPRGQVSEFTGDSGAGKTTLAMRIVAASQAAGTRCAWLDVEQSFDESLAASCGVDLEALIYDNPTYAEEATEFILDLVNTGEVGIIVVDSIGAYNPKKRLEGEVGKVGQPALRARAVGELSERLLGPLAKTNAVLLGINHLTGLLQSDFVGNQRTTAKGGRTWNYLKSCSLHLKASKTEVVNGSPVAAEVEVRVDKCRRAPRGATATLLNVMGQGFSVMDDLVESGIKAGIIEINKGWHTLSGRRLNGRGALVKLLAEDSEVRQTLIDTLDAA